MPSRPTKEDIFAVLSPFHARIRRVFEEAWGQHLSVRAYRIDQGMGPLLYDRTAANEIFDNIARLASKEFALDDHVHVKVEAQTMKFFFSGRVVVRFKKGDCQKLGQNIPTRADWTFVDPDGVLPGFPPATPKVEIVWQANEIGAGLEGVYVVARDNNVKLWDYEILPPATEGVVDLPHRQRDFGELEDDDMVRPRKERDRKKHESE